MIGSVTEVLAVIDAAVNVTLPSLPKALDPPKRV
jgi:hypothetical protein